MEITLEQRPLFVEVGHHIARAMWQTIGRSDPTYETEMYDMAMSVFEHGCGLMQDLGVFECTTPGSYKFTMPLEKVRAYLTTLEPQSTYTFDEMIGNFIWACSEHQTDISTEKDPFEVPGYMQEAMWAFVSLGYATREPAGFQWTPRMATIMIAEYLWSNEGDSYATLDKQRDLEFAHQIWKAVPIWRRHLLARWIKGKSEMDVFLYLFRRWDGKRIHLKEIPAAKRGMLPSGYQVATREVAQKLIDIRRSHPF